MVQCEPSPLSEVRSLARRLEMQPALLLEFLGAGGVREGVGCVVGFEEVLDDRTRFPQFHARVGVLDGRDTAVWILGLERWLFEFGEVHDHTGVGNVEL